MTNELAIATIVMVSYVTNVIERPPEPRGNTWFRTNVIEAIVELTTPGLPTVTNKMVVATNTVRLTIFEDTLPSPRPTPGKAITAAEAKARGLPTAQKK